MRELYSRRARLYDSFQEGFTIILYVLGRTLKDLVEVNIKFLAVSTMANRLTAL
jgi:hypothetical protein